MIEAVQLLGTAAEQLVPVIALNVPLTGPVPMAKVRASPLASVPPRVMASAVLDGPWTVLPAAGHRCGVVDGHADVAGCAGCAWATR